MSLNAREAGDPIIFRAELRERLGGICNQTLRRYRKKGVIPDPDLALSRTNEGWKLSTLVAHGVRLAEASPQRPAA